jgi:CO/xanthine dehydrogenase FAD-binding subunit
MDLAFVEALEPASLAALDSWRPGDAWLAGGTALFSEPDPALRRLYDLRAFGWPSLTLSPAGLEIAATCTVRELHEFHAPAHWRAARLLRDCPGALYASWKVWGEATVGGNLCLALPAGAMTSLVAGLDGICTIWSPGGTTRRLTAPELVTGPGTAALAPGELLRSVAIPERALSSRVAFRQVSLSPRGRSAALVTGRREPDGATHIALTAAVPRPLVLRFAAPPSPRELTQALTDADPGYFDDVHGDPDWRAHLSALLCEEVRAELETLG